MRFSSVQLLSRVRLFVTPWTAAFQTTLSITNSQSLLKLMFIESVMPSNHLILCHPPSPALNLSQHQGFFQWVGSLHHVAKELQLQHQPFQWIFRVDFLQDGQVQSPCSPRDSQESSPTPQSETSVPWRSAFFMVQPSHSYMTTGKAIALTIQIFVSKGRGPWLYFQCDKLRF